MISVACGGGSSAPPKKSEPIGVAKKDHSIDRIAIAGDSIVTLDQDGVIAKIVGTASKPVKTVADARRIAVSASGEIAVVTREAVTIGDAALVLPKDRSPIDVAFTANGFIVLASAPTEYSEHVHLLAYDKAKKLLSDGDGFSRSEDIDDCELGWASDVLAIVDNCYGAHALRVKDAVELAAWQPSRTSRTGSVAEVAPGQFAFGWVTGEDDYQFSTWLPAEKLQHDARKDASPCVLSKTGKLAACETDKKVSIFETKTYQVRQTADVPEYAQVLAFSPEGTKLVAGLSNDQVVVIDTSAVHAAAPELAKLPAILSIDPAVTVARDVPAKRLMQPTNKIAFEYRARTAKLAPDGKHLGIVGAEGQSLDLASGKFTHLFDTPEGIHPPEMAWSPDGKTYALVESDPKERISIGEKEVATDIKEAHVAWSNKGVIATGGPHYGEIQLWDAETLAKKQVLEPPQKQWLGGLLALADGRVMSWGDWAPTMVWDVTNGSSTILVGHGESLYAVAAVGALIATAGRDNAVIVWDAGTLAPKIALRGFDTPMSLALSPDGTRVAVSDRSGISIWTVADGKPSLRWELEGAEILTWADAGLVVTARELGIGIFKP